MTDVASRVNLERVSPETLSLAALLLARTKSLRRVWGGYRLAPLRARTAVQQVPRG